MKILGIETSCDETAASVVEDGRLLLSNVVASSVDLHVAYGGVVPEIAARSHLESIMPVIEKALNDALVPSHQSLITSGKKQKDWRLTTGDWRLQFDPWDQIDAIAVTQGPGLPGSLLIGVMAARTLAITKQKPLYAIDHVHAHVYAIFLTEVSSSLSTNYDLPAAAPKFPILALIVSGGHTQLVLFKDHFKYHVLGQTTDDAVGEAFDKVAKLLGLPYPGGPSIAKAAKHGNPRAIKLPRAKMQNKYDFSFSGLKTAVLRASQALVGKDYTLPSHQLADLLSETQKNDIAASFQRTALETLIAPVKLALEEFRPATVVVAGGVSANLELRRLLSKTLDTEVIYTDIKLCTDNAAMIAALGFYKAKYNRPKADPYSLEIFPDLAM